MKHRSLQKELPRVGDVFNLVIEAAADPWRVDRERWQAAERKAEALQYQARMQRLFEQCPGFLGCDCPSSEKSSGKVVIEPGHILEAIGWLKRRFHVSENLDLSLDNGLVVEVKPRSRRRTASSSNNRPAKVQFGRPEQFTLQF